MFVCVHMEPKLKVKEKNRGHFKGFLSLEESAAVGIFRIRPKTRVLGDQIGPALDLNCNTALLPPLCLVLVQHGNVVNDHGKLQWKSTTRLTTQIYLHPLRLWKSTRHLVVCEYICVHTYIYIPSGQEKGP